MSNLPVHAPQNVVFRCDASHLIGTGHLKRCISLARAFKERGFTSIFVCRNRPTSMHRAIQKMNLTFLSCQNVFQITQISLNIGIG